MILNVSAKKDSSISITPLVITSYSIHYTKLYEKKINENEILSLYEFAKQRDIQIRFIEYMENEMAYNQLKTLTSQEILNIISTKYSFETVENSVNSAAKLYDVITSYSIHYTKLYELTLLLNIH